MLRTRAYRLARHVGWFRIVRWGVAISVLCLAGGIVFRLVAPNELQRPTADDAVSMGADLTGESFIDSNPDDSDDPAAILSTVRRGLFKSAAPMRDRPVADKTIEKIRAQLSLGCVLELEGESVAYIRVKDMGLKRCKIGDSVEDLFTVLDINEKSVVVSIIDHRVKLSL